MQPNNHIDSVFAIAVILLFFFCGFCLQLARMYSTGIEEYYQIHFKLKFNRTDYRQYFLALWGFMVATGIGFVVTLAIYINYLKGYTGRYKTSQITAAPVAHLTLNHESRILNHI